MSVTAHLERWNMLHDAAGRMARAPSLDAAIEVVRGSARGIATADGVTVVRVIGDRVAYVAEDAISPLWTGQSFPIDSCISGIAIRLGRPVAIPDIAQDSRVPMQLYRSTFVRSMLMMPFPGPDPRGAIGAYWRETGEIDGRTIMLLSTLASALSHVLETRFGDDERAADAA